MSGRDVDKLRNKGIKVLFPNQCLKMAYFTRRGVAKVHSKYPWQTQLFEMTLALAQCYKMSNLRRWKRGNMFGNFDNFKQF